MMHSSSQPKINGQTYVTHALEALKISIKDKEKKKVTLKFSEIHHIFEVAYQDDHSSLVNAKQDQYDPTLPDPTHSLFLSALNKFNDIFANSAIAIHVSYQDLQLFSHLFFNHLIIHLPGTDNPGYTQLEELQKYRAYTELMASNYTQFLDRLFACKCNESVPRSFMNIQPLFEACTNTDSCLKSEATHNTIDIDVLQQWNHTLLRLIYLMLSLRNQKYLQDYEVLMLIVIIDTYRLNRHNLRTYLKDEKLLLSVEEIADKETRNLCVKYAGGTPPNDFYLYLWMLISNFDSFKQMLLKRFKATTPEACLTNAIASGCYEHVILITTYLNPDFNKDITFGKNNLELCIEILIDLLKQPLTEENKLKFGNIRSIAKLLAKMMVVNRKLSEYEDKLLSLVSTPENESYIKDLKELIISERLRFLRLNYRDETDGKRLPSVEACIARAAFSGHSKDLQVMFLTHKSTLGTPLDPDKISSIHCKMMHHVLDACENHQKDASTTEIIHNYFKVIATLHEQGATLTPADAKALLEKCLIISKSKHTVIDFEANLIWLESLIRCNLQDEKINNNNNHHRDTEPEVLQHIPTQEIAAIPTQNLKHLTITDLLKQIQDNGAKDNPRQLIDFLAIINKQCQQKKLIIIDKSNQVSLTLLAELIMGVLVNGIEKNDATHVTALADEFVSLMSNLMDGYKQINLPKLTPFVDIKALVSALKQKNSGKETADMNRQIDFNLPEVVSHLLRVFMTLDQLNLLSFVGHMMLWRIIDEFRPSLIKDNALKELLMSAKQPEHARQQDFFKNLWHFVCDRNHYLTMIQQQYHLPHHDKKLPDRDLCLRRAAQQGDSENVMLLCSIYKADIHSTTSTKPKLNCLELAIDQWFTLLHAPQTPENTTKLTYFAKMATFLITLGAKNEKLSHYEELLPKLKSQIDGERYSSFSYYVKGHRLMQLQQFYYTPQDGNHSISITECLRRAALMANYDNIRIIVSYQQDLTQEKYPRNELTATMQITIQQALHVAMEIKKNIKNAKSIKKLQQELKSSMDTMRFLVAQGGQLVVSDKKQLVALITSLLRHLPNDAKNELHYALTLLGENAVLVETVIASESNNDNSQASSKTNAIQTLSSEIKELEKLKESKLQEHEKLSQELEENRLKEERILKLTRMLEENKAKIKSLEKVQKSYEKKYKVKSEKVVELTDDEIAQIAAKKQEEAELKKQEALQRKQKEAEEREKREARERQLQIEAEANKQALLKKKQEEAENRRKEARLREQKEQEAAAQKREAKKKKKQLKPVSVDKMQVVTAATATHQLFQRAALQARKAEFIPEKMELKPYSYQVNGVTVKTTCPFNAQGHAVDKDLFKLTQPIAIALQFVMPKFIDHQIHALISHLCEGEAKPEVYYTGGYVAYFLSNKQIPYSDVDMGIIVPVDSLNELEEVVQNCEAFLDKHSIHSKRIFINLVSFQYYLLQFTYKGMEYDFNFTMKKNADQYFKNYINVKSTFYNYHTHELHDMHHAIAGFAMSRLTFMLEDEPLAPIHICILLTKLMSTHSKWTIETKDYELFLKSLSTDALPETVKAADDFYFSRFKKIAKYIVRSSYKDRFIFLMNHFQDEFKRFFKFNDKQFKQFLYLLKHLIIERVESSDLHDKIIAKIMDKTYRMLQGKTDDPYIQSFMEKNHIKELLASYSEKTFVITQFELPYVVERTPSNVNTSVNNTMTMFAVPQTPTAQATERAMTPEKSANNNNF